MTDAQPPTEREKVAASVVRLLGSFWAQSDEYVASLVRSNTAGKFACHLAVADYILARERQAFVNGYARAAKDAIEKWETVP